MDSQLNDEGNYFTWKGIRIYQDEDVLKVGTDALLLGSWLFNLIDKAFMILDVGTGTGILSLMMAKRFPNSKIVAIDQEQQAVRLAQMNIAYSGWKDRINVKAESIFVNAEPHDALYDLVICNPPYFTTQILPQKDSLQKAKHTRFRVSEWMEALIRKTTPEANIAIVVPAETACHWINAANEIGFYNVTRLDIYSFQEDPMPKRSLLHFTDQLRQPVIHRMNIYMDNREYSTAYLEFTGIQSTKSKTLSEQVRNK